LADAGANSARSASTVIYRRTALMSTTALDLWAPRILSILRIVAALIFFEHGTQKLLGFPPHANPPAVLSLSWIAGALELVGGALLILGLWTRPVAFILSGEMAFAYWISHAPRSFFPVLNGGDAAILYCFVFLYFVFSGPGPWSVDAMRLGRGSAARLDSRVGLT
jgi:putative oxidoreductase